MSYNYYTLYIVSFAGGLFLAMLLCLNVGRRLGLRQMAGDPDAARSSPGVIEGSILALLGLLIAFTFSSAASRFEQRRHLCAEEANAIGTAYLRTALIEGPEREELRAGFRRYVESRLESSRKLPDVDAAWKEFGRAMMIQQEIWQRAVVACHDQNSQPATMLLLPALNQMIDLSKIRVTATMSHPPLLIYGVLAAVALMASVIAGYGLAGRKNRSRIHAIGFAAMIATTIYVILDLEAPRLGLVRLREADHFLAELLQTMD
jgi:hypothetical protein